MATDPSFAATPRVAAAIPVTAETSLTAPAQSIVVMQGGTNGTLINTVIVEAVTTSLVPTTVAGLVYLFLYDGTTYHLFDTVLITALTPSATTAPFRARQTYTDMVLPANTWYLRASQSIAGNASILKVTAIGADF